MLTKKLSIVGHGSSALLIDKPLLAMLGLDPRAEVELEIEKGQLVVRPAKRRTKR